MAILARASVGHCDNAPVSTFTSNATEAHALTRKKIDSKRVGATYGIRRRCAIGESSSNPIANVAPLPYLVNLVEPFSLLSLSRIDSTTTISTEYILHINTQQ